MKLTAPVGEPPELATVAVKVIGLPASAGFAEEAMVAVVAAAGPPVHEIA
jgi:hypothetical protein